MRTAPAREADRLRNRQRFYRAFGRRIRELRRARGFSQARLAEAADVTPLTISNIERGVNPPSFTRLARLADALDVEIRELFLFEHRRG